MEQKTEVPGFFKADEGVVINKDNEALRAYRLRKQKENKICELENKIDILHDDISEIKNILKGLIK